MTAEEAKQVLDLYRPGVDEHDAQITAALEQVDRDPDLRAWLDRRTRFHSLMREKLSGVQIPPALKDQIVQRTKIVPASFPRFGAVALAIAAALALILGAYAFWPAPAEDRFEAFQSRMVSTVLREYRMDIVTNDSQGIRSFLAGKGAPADYELPTIARDLTPTGAGVLRWQNQRVSMLCFENRKSEPYFLFIAKRESISEPPATALDRRRVNTLQTASWSLGSNVYMLAGPDALRTLQVW